MKPTHAFVVAVVSALAAFPAAAQYQAQFSTSDSAIKYRQGAFSVMAQHFSRVAMMAQGIQPYDAKTAQENADLVNSLAKLPFSAFGPGTDKGVPNRAKAEIWKDPVKFKAASDRMVADAAQLDAAAKTGSIDALKVAVGAVGKSCKSCHDDFRNSQKSID
jgi:cytochrome c556